jgi:hypothetical protein
MFQGFRRKLQADKKINLINSPHWHPLVPNVAVAVKNEQ